jgi:hypothetical protein
VTSAFDGALQGGQRRAAVGRRCPYYHSTIKSVMALEDSTRVDKWLIDIVEPEKLLYTY